MNAVSIIIAILLLALLGTALYKGIFHKNKINNPYSSDFEDMTQGTKPTMDGKNPITQTQEKGQQVIKDENFNEQEITTLEEEHATLNEDFLNEQNLELGATKNLELDHSSFEEEVESTEQWTNKAVPPIAKLPDENVNTTYDESTIELPKDEEVTYSTFEEEAALASENEQSTFDEEVAAIEPQEEQWSNSETPIENVNTTYEEPTSAVSEFETTSEPEITSVEPNEEQWADKKVPPVTDLSWGAAAEKASLEDSQLDKTVPPVSNFPSPEDLEAEKNFDKLANEQDPLDERFKEHDDFIKSQVDLSKKNEPGA